MAVSTVRRGSGSASGALQIRAGAVHTCAACGDGSLWCWGGNMFGQTGGSGQFQCGPNQTCDPSPVQVTLPGPLKELLAGHDSSCVQIDVSGTTKLYCMGNNTNGQFGISQPQVSSTLVSTEIVGSTGYAGGSLHACEIVGARVECQGGNMLGQLGIGNTSNQPQVTPMTTQPIVTATLLAAGDTHTCAADANGSPSCWGDNTYGAVDGTPATTPVSSPRQVASLPPALELAAGAGHTCARATDGVYCWGRNQFGEVGQTPPSQTAGLTFLTIAGVKHIAAGGTQSCALTTDGIVYCWGSPDGMTAMATPTQIQLPMAATAFTVGASHACAILMDASVWCWGADSFGEIGDGTHDNQRHGPTRVPVCQ
jgi:alpha-tubulin suppressor-like RCC1 family protein